MKYRHSFFAVSFSLLLSVSWICRGAMAADVEILSTEEAPKLRELRENKFVSGRLTAEINGSKEEFMTTSETIIVTEEQLAKVKPEGRAFLSRMNGKVVDTAAIRAVAGQLFVTIDAHGNMEATGPKTTGDRATSVKISFQLDPKTLQPMSRGQELTYAAPGVSVGDSAKTNDFDLKLASITRLPDGALALKGSFSGKMTQTLREKPLEKPVGIRGEFQIDRASGNDAVAKLIKLR